MEQWKIIAIILIIVTAGLLGYGVWKRGMATDTTQTPTKEESDITSTGRSKQQQIWIGIAILGAIVLIASYIYYQKEKGEGGIFAAKAMTPDEFDEIFKERMIMKEGLKGYYDETGTLQYAPNTVRFTDQRPWTPTGTSHDFLAKTVEILDPEIEHISGVHTIMVNLNREKKLINGGLFTKNEHTNLWDWIRYRSYLKKLPPSTPESENLQMAQYASEHELDLSELQQLKGATRPQQIEEEYSYPYSKSVKPVPYTRDEEIEDEEITPQTEPWYRKITASKKKKFPIRRG